MPVIDTDAAILTALLAAGCVPRHAAGSAIDVAVDEKKRLSHIVDSLDLLLYVCLLILTIVTVWILKNRRFRFLHESGLAIFYGLVVGMLLRLLGSDTRPVSHMLVEPHRAEGQQTRAVAAGMFTDSPPDTLLLSVNVSAPESREGSRADEYITEAGGGGEKLFAYKFEDEFSSNVENPIQEQATFNPEIFFYVLLPPIIFHAGYSMRKKQFFDNLGAIMAFALIGTTISSFVIAIIMYGFAQFMPSMEIRFMDTLYFGAIISATDPVTVLSIFQDLHVDSMLNGLVLGESLLNDAVAIVLCSAIEEYAKVSLTQGEGFELNAMVLTVIKFFTILVGSVGLGAVIGCLASVITKFTRVRDSPLLETSLFSLLSYSSYLIAEICEMSGIVAVLFCGIFQAHYTFHNLSLESKQRTKQLFEVLNFLAENFIFCYIGVTMFTFSKHNFNFIFIFGSFVAMAVARAFNIYPLSFLANLGRRQKIPGKFQHMLWFSGLRGALAFALAVRNTVSDVRQMFFTTVCLISIITVVFVGGLTLPMLTLLDIPVGILDEEREELLRDDESLLDPASSSPSTPSPDKRTYLARIWRGFDTRYMKPMLTSAQPTLMETLPAFCGPFARCFTSDEQRLDGHHVNCSNDGAEGENSRAEGSQREGGSRFYDDDQQLNRDSLVNGD